MRRAAQEDLDHRGQRARAATFAFDLREKALSDDTTFNRGFQACHDVQVFMPKELAVGACAGDGQLWDISDPANPTMSNGEPHTHIRSPGGRPFEFIHSGIVSWDGKTFAIMDETGGGVRAAVQRRRLDRTASTTSTTW